MKLVEVVNEYVRFKQSLGMVYKSQSGVLRAFCWTLGDIDINEVRSKDVLNFIAGNSSISGFWHKKYTILTCFYRFAIGRSYTISSPLPKTLPKCPEPMAPYIYSSEDIERLLSAAETLRTPQSFSQADTFRALLLTLYGTGMRIGETLSLKLNDVNLSESLITIKDAKFFKSRLVPIGPRLTNELSIYVEKRRRLPCLSGDESAFFVTCKGNALTYDWAGRVFRLLRNRADVSREAEARYQPRIHDFRHAFAVHRLIAWYREGTDVQKMLPLLASYLGHKDLNSTQRYLSMIPELQQEASHRFEQYALTEVKND